MVRAKIPGFAEWGASAEDARAKVGVRVSPVYSVATTIGEPIGSAPVLQEGVKDPFELPWQVIGKLETR